MRRSSIALCLIGALGLGCGDDGDGRCFAPDRTPELVNEPEVIGCPCDGQAEVCVRTEDDWVALACDGSRWTAAEDAGCPAQGTACMIHGAVYASGSSGIPSPFDTCNTCTCDDGDAVCTEIACPGSGCPEGTVPASTCAECGPAGGCAVALVGCLFTCENSDDCQEPTPFCSAQQDVCSPVAGCF